MSCLFLCVEIGSSDSNSSANSILRPGLNEYFSGFANIGHNNAYDLILLWIIPNGLWLIFPTYIIYVLGIEMLEALDGSKAEKEE